LRPKLIAIDGPVGVGKSSVGSLLAKKLGYIFLDTGMLYRAFTWKAIELGISPQDEEALCRLAEKTRFEFAPLGEGSLALFIDGRDVSSRLFCSEVEEKVSLVARVAGVRQVIMREQRKLARKGDLIMAGRDIGTVVLPWAELKIFLIASREERAKRRYKDLRARGKDLTLEQVLDELKERDERDMNRPISPLKPAKDAIIIDTENLTLEQVVDEICSLIDE